MEILQHARITKVIKQNALNFETLNDHAQSLQILIAHSTELARQRNSVECKELMELMAKANELARITEEIAEAIG